MFGYAEAVETIGTVEVIGFQSFHKTGIDNRAERQLERFAELKIPSATPFDHVSAEWA